MYIVPIIGLLITNEGVLLCPIRSRIKQQVSVLKTLHTLNSGYSFYIEYSISNWSINYQVDIREPRDFAIFDSAMNDSPLEFNRSKLVSKPGDDKDDSSQSPSEKRSRSNSQNTRNRKDTEKSYDSDSNMSGSQDMVSIQNGPGLTTSNMWNSMMGELLFWPLLN